MDTIHRGNYEEFFLLYVDNELSAEAKKAVDEFVSMNPDLKVELEILLDTKLETEAISFDQKESLFKESLSIEEYQLLAIDNELNEEQLQALNDIHRTDEQALTDYELLKKTKLPADAIIYPHKQQLYKRSAPIIALRWLSVGSAAAAIIVGFWLLNQQPETNTTPPVATPIAKIETPVTKQVLPRNTDELPTIEETGEQAMPEAMVAQTTTAIPVEEAIAAVEEKVEKPMASLSKPTATVEQPIIASTLAIDDNISVQPIASTTDIVTETSFQYTQDEEEEDQQRKGLRGIARKVSRIYTKITQPDDEKPLFKFALSKKD